MAAQVTFHQDILGNLPIELVWKVAEYLNLADLFVLQRVSPQWRSLLSSPLLQRAAIRSVMAVDLPQQNLDLDNTKAIIQQRLCAERGNPARSYYLETTMASIQIEGSTIPRIDYSHGIFAFITPRHNYTDIARLSLDSGDVNYLTTEDRDHLTQIGVSQQLIAAVSRRGYCHVWDLRSGAHRSFRLSSLHYTHFLVNGLKVMVVYRTAAIHWGWDSGIARTIKLDTYPVMVAAHPTEDQFTIVRVGEDVYYGAQKVIVNKNCHMIVEQFAASSTEEFRCKHSQKQRFPLDDRGKLPYPDNLELLDPLMAQEIYPGQSSILMVTKEPSAHIWWALWFSLENNTVVTHRVTTHQAPISRVRCMGKGLLYASHNNEKGPRLLILDSTYTTPASPTDMRECWHVVSRDIPIVESFWFLGDSDYGLFMSEMALHVWCFGNPLWTPTTSEHILGV